ncbi:MAG: hypothetical protein MJZ06_07900 [Bacteroidaceae bacterium]|nr:hypothetical protein [Bacteroidaceae bacterium]
MMKKLLVPIMIVILSVPMTVHSQTEKPERIVTFLKTEHDARWYAHQATLWENEVNQNPENDDAWYFWFTATRYRLMHETEDMQGYDDEPLKAIAYRLHKERPESFARYVIDSECRNHVKGFEGFEDHMTEAVMMRPDFEELYPAYVVHLMSNGEYDLMADILKRWYETGRYSYVLLSYAYNCLAGMDKDGILFVFGDNDTFSNLLIQYGKELMQDRIVINRTLFTYVPNYREQICRKLGIEIEGPSDYSTEAVDRWAEEQIAYMAKTTGRSIYFSSMYKPELLNDSLYSEGLVMKYSTRKYDNLSAKRRNYESVYFKDYLYETFVPETFEASAYRLNLNYIPCFKSLLDFYRTQGLKTEYNKLHGLMLHIVRECESIDGFDSKPYYEEIER